MRLTDLVFHEPEVSVFTGWHLFVTLLIAIVGLALCFFFAFKDGNGKTSANLSIFMIIIGAIMLVFAPAVSSIVYPVTSANNAESPSASIQKWANETYAIELNKKDAQKLFDGKNDYDEDSNETLLTGVTANYYNDEIIVRLVKSDNQWKLFSNDKALPMMEVTQ